MKILANNVYSTLIEPDSQFVEQLDEILSYDIPNAKYIRRNKLEKLETKLDKAENIDDMIKIKRDIDYWSKEWDGKVHLLNNKTYTFPSGLIYVIKAVYPDIEIVDQRREPEKSIHYEWREKIILEEYQKEAILEAEEVNYRCVLHAATSAGKTIMAIKIIKELGVKTVIIVPTLTLLKQWQDNLNRFLDVTLPENKPKNYRILHDENDKECILVTTIAFLHRVLYDKRESTAERNKMYRKFIRDSDMLIYDECHRGSSPQSQAVLSRLRCYYRMGLTATPDMRTDKTDIVYHGFLGPNVANISRKRIVKEGRAVMPTIRFIAVPPRYYHSGTKYWEIYEDYICDNNERDEIIYQESLRASSKGKKVLVLTDRVEHCKKLGEIYDDNRGVYTHGEDNERFEKFEKWMKGDVPIMVCTVQLIGEGFDFPELETMILAGSWKSKTRTIQTIGRLMRKAARKYGATFVDFANNARYLYEHTIKRATYWYNDGFNVDVKDTFLENYIKENHLEGLEEED